ncbi:MAG: zinc-binding dehydrogenase [Nitrososphaeraceae archaeon]
MEKRYIDLKTAGIVKPKEPLEIKEHDPPKPNGSQILIIVQSAGVCHSDIHLPEGGYEGLDEQFLKATDRVIKYPLTPGHEVAGYFESLGDEASTALEGSIHENKKVLVYPWIGEGLCPTCRIDEENLCDKPRSLGIYAEGGYAEYVLVPSYTYLIKMGAGDDHDLNADSIATLSCSPLTGYGAVKKVNIGPNDNVVIVGADGLGLMAIQLAKAVTGARIIAMDLDDDKVKLAKENRADNIINSKREDAAQVVMELTNKLGADAVIDFVIASKTVETDMQLLRRRAKLVLVGLFSGELKLKLVTMLARAYKLIGSYTGSITDLIELVSLAKREVIKPIISNRFKLYQATEALEMLKNGKILGRGVINP